MLVLDFVLVILILYLLECFLKVGPADIVFVKTTGLRYRIKKPHTYPSNGSWGWVFLNPLQPAVPVFVGRKRSLAFTRLGIVVHPDSPGDSRVVPYDSCQTPTRSERVVGLDADIAIVLPSTIEARDAARQCSLTCSLPPDERAVWMNAEVHRSFDITKIRMRLRSFSERTKFLRIAIRMQCTILLLLFPLAGFWFGPRAVILPAAAAALLLSVVIATSYKAAYDELYPGGNLVEKWSTCIKMILYPISSLRALDEVAPLLFYEYDPIGVAYVLCEKRRADTLAARRLAELENTVIDDDGAEGPHFVLREYRRSAAGALRLFLEGVGSDPTALLRPPEPAADSCLGYCPVCLTQYTHDAGLCSDCGNVALRRLDRPLGARWVSANRGTGKRG